MKILLAIDGSAHDDAVVDAIVHRPLPAGCDVRVVSVVVQLPAPGMLAMQGAAASIYVEIENAARSLARTALDKAAAALKAVASGNSLNVTTEVLYGHPSKAILDESAMFDADLIVVGSHGHGTLERFLLGSVSHAVALHAKCSVEIVRPK